MLKSHKSKMDVIYICNHENNVPSRLSPQWLYGNSCIWAHDVRLLSCTYIYEIIKYIKFAELIFIKQVKIIIPFLGYTMFYVFPQPLDLKTVETYRTKCKNYLVSYIYKYIYNINNIYIYDI